MGSFHDPEEIRAKFPILEVARLFGFKDVKQDAPTVFRGNCPFCSDPRTFRITTDGGDHKQGMAGCFKCGKKGLDSLRIVQLKLNLKMNEAAEYLIEHMGKGTVSNVPNSTVPTPPQDDRLQKIAERLDHECDEVQALRLSPETAEDLGIGLDHKGGTRGWILFPLFFKDGRRAGFLAYSPDQEPTIKLPENLLIPANVVKFPKAG